MQSTVYLVDLGPDWLIYLNLDHICHLWDSLPMFAQHFIQHKDKKPMGNDQLGFPMERINCVFHRVRWFVVAMNMLSTRYPIRQERRGSKLHKRQSRDYAKTKK